MLNLQEESAEFEKEEDERKKETPLERAKRYEDWIQKVKPHTEEGNFNLSKKSIDTVRWAYERIKNTNKGYQEQLLNSDPRVINPSLIEEFTRFKKIEAELEMLVTRCDTHLEKSRATQHTYKHAVQGVQAAAAAVSTPIQEIERVVEQVYRATPNEGEGMTIRRVIRKALEDYQSNSSEDNLIVLVEKLQDAGIYKRTCKTVLENSLQQYPWLNVKVQEIKEKLFTAHGRPTM